MSKKKESFSGAVEEVVSFYTQGFTEEPEKVEEAINQEQPEEKASEQEQKPTEEKLKDIDLTPKEYKSRRVQILLKPKIHDSLKELAEQLKAETGNKHISVNDLINKILEAYLKEL